MKIGIIVFPGTTCERDTSLWCEKGGHTPFYISHRETRIPSNTDLLILPGGFAFGDRVYEEATGHYVKNPGVQALLCPVMNALQACVHTIPILGICNGFQILIHAGLLEGSLERNIPEKFHCDHTLCCFDVTKSAEPLRYGEETSPLPSLFYTEETVIDVPVANGYGRYTPPIPSGRVWRRSHVFLSYVDGYSVNGSAYGIAGVCNTEHTVWGMMPHPERSPRAQELLKGIEEYVTTNF